MLIGAPRRILFATAPVDFRKSIDGLAAIVELHLREPPLSGQMFVFTNRRRDGLKLLVWDRGGFFLIYKHLERGRFQFPSTDADRRVLTPVELAAILDGIDLGRARQLPRWNPLN